MDISWGALFVGLIIGACTGASTIALFAAGKIQELQRQLDAKRSAWCEDCHYKKDLKAAEEIIARERKGSRALGGIVNKQLFEIKRMRRELRKAGCVDSEMFFDASVVRH